MLLLCNLTGNGKEVFVLSDEELELSVRGQLAEWWGKDVIDSWTLLRVYRSVLPIIYIITLNYRIKYRVSGFPTLSPLKRPYRTARSQNVSLKIHNRKILFQFSWQTAYTAVETTEIPPL